MSSQCTGVLTRSAETYKSTDFDLHEPMMAWKPQADAELARDDGTVGTLSNPIEVLTIHVYDPQEMRLVSALYVDGVLFDFVWPPEEIDEYADGVADGLSYAGLTYYRVRYTATISKEDFDHVDPFAARFSDTESKYGDALVEVPAEDENDWDL